MLSAVTRKRAQRRSVRGRRGCDGAIAVANATALKLLRRGAFFVILGRFVWRDFRQPKPSWLCSGVSQATICRIPLNGTQTMALSIQIGSKWQK